MKIGEAFGQKTSSLTNRTSDWFLQPHLKMGLEFEYEGCAGIPYGQAFGPYTTKEDGSLRNYGCEFVFTQPLFGKDLENGIMYMTELALAKKFQVTSRCSVHAHMDVRELEAEQLMTLLLLYAVYEDAFYRFVGEDRRDGNFCVPWHRAGGEIGSYLRFMVSDSKDTNIQTYRKLQRYSGLNLASLPKYGSIEFRHLGGTRDYQRVKDWLNCIMALYKVATEWKEVGYDVLLKLSSQGLLATALNIFPGWFMAHYRQEWAEEGILVAQDLLSRSGNIKFKPQWK